MSTEEQAHEGATEQQQENKGPTIEEVAALQGWNPDYDGPDKIDAAEYVRRKPLFDKIKAQSRELKEIKKVVDGMANSYKAMSEAQYRKGIADAEKRMKAAETALDVEAYKEAAADKRAFEEQAKSVSNVEPPEVTAFCERNPWFDSNPAMRTDALEYSAKFEKLNPQSSIKDRLDYVEKKIRRDYPEHFEDKEKKHAPAPRAASVEGASAPGAVDDLAKFKASMTGEEKRIMRMFVKEGGLTEAEYLKDYMAVRDR